MKQLINKTAARHLLSLALIVCMACLWSGCSDDNDVEFITDTSLSILQENRASLEYLLSSSAYGTAPGTFPESSKQILNTAINELDTHIAKLKNGEGITDSALESLVAKTNQAIDSFKNSRLYNLSETARELIRKLNAKAAEYETLLEDNTVWGDHKGQYPIDSKTILQKAIDDLYAVSERAQSGAITNFTQELFDDAMASAEEQKQKLEATKWEEDHITWNLFVDGNKGGYIDFGYNEDYVRFGADNHQSFTIELWVNVKEFCSKSGEDNSTFLASYVSSPRSGWRVQYRKSSGKDYMRGTMAHWQNEGPKDPEWWEPRASVPNPRNNWTHFAFAVSDDGVPGFSPPQSHSKACVFVNGTQTGDVIRVGEAWRTYLEDGCVDKKMPLTGFCRLGSDQVTREEYFSGYLKYIRIWKSVRSRDEIRLSSLGETDVDPNDPNLVAAWDFEVLGSQPTGTIIPDLTGRHTATLKGPDGTYKWVESTTIAIQ
ncbi:DUF4972 domain-containing protein [Bacteroides sp. 224]|uniref:DUF4972 domain-containing protein n=1 Tax=Bacteroides sp. 224 TaxID=2302936 RepID=UPI0019403652|nr:DUF4972 domain-containing protein [Bacteroides sp. 224]